jgi:MrcB-like, N-terminal domain
MLNKVISDVRIGWPAYRAGGVVSREHGEYKLVVTDFKLALEPHLPKSSAYRIEGSTGKGNITSAPWIATFDRSVTTTATQGFYLVYLYSVDLKLLYLSLACHFLMRSLGISGPSGTKRI